MLYKNADIVDAISVFFVQRHGRNKSAKRIDSMEFIVAGKDICQVMVLKERNRKIRPYEQFVYRN